MQHYRATASARSKTPTGPATSIPAGLPTLDEMLASSGTEITAHHIAALGTCYELARAELARRPRSAAPLAVALGRAREVWARLRWEDRVNALAAGAARQDAAV